MIHLINLLHKLPLEVKSIAETLAMNLLGMGSIPN